MAQPQKINPVLLQQPIVGVDMTQQDYNNLQQQGLANIMPNQSLINRSMMTQQQPRVIADVSPQSMAVAGANRNGVDWAGLLGNLGSYMAAAGSAYGTGANPSQGLLNAANATQKHTQNINQYRAMAPAYQQMGIDPTRFDPRRGGAGIATTPLEMVDLQSKIAERNYLNNYRQTMAEARLAQQQQKQQSTPTIGDLMMYNPQFKQMMNAQYDFSNGQNADVLSRPMPKEVLQSLMPKNVNMRYSGGLNSSKNVKVDSTYNGAGKNKKPNAHTW